MGVTKSDIVSGEDASPQCRLQHVAILPFGMLQMINFIHDYI